MEGEDFIAENITFENSSPQVPFWELFVHCFIFTSGFLFDFLTYTNDMEMEQ